MKNLLGMTVEELKVFAVEELGEKAYRGRQIFVWVNRGVTDFDEMTDLPKSLREELKARAFVGDVSVLDVKKDRKDGTQKFIFGFGEPAERSADAVEGVFMKYRYGNSLCVSSQVGCRMGCKFCASAIGGFVRNLTAGEMLGQVFATEKYTGEPINRIVVMGMGEPFDNYDELKRFLEILHDTEGKNLSYRNITVSTCGIVPAIERFADDFPQVNLAVSLHRADDEGRSAIMPINRKWPVDQLLDTVRGYVKKTGRRVTFEYALIRGENDAPEDIMLLREKLRGILCHVNLIPLNKVEESGLKGTTRARAEEFASQLEDAGIPTTVRRELGGEIDGACGQLRRRYMICDKESDRYTERVRK